MISPETVKRSLQRLRFNRIALQLAKERDDEFRIREAVDVINDTLIDLLETALLKRDTNKIIEISNMVRCEDCAKPDCEIRGNSHPMPCSDYIQQEGKE